MAWAWWCCAPGRWCRSICWHSAPSAGPGPSYAWPKPFLPIGFSGENFTAFLHVAGIWSAMLRSVEVAVMCMAFSIALGAPAGYALARYAFRGATVYRLVILLTRAFPVGILALPLAVSYVRARHLRHAVRCRTDPHRPGTAVRGAGQRQPVPRHPARAGGGGLGVRLLGQPGVPPDRAAAGAAGDRGRRHLRLRHLLERGVRGDRAHGAATRR